MKSLAILLVAFHLGNADFFIRSRSTNKCIDISGDPGTGNGFNAQLWDCEFQKTNSDQEWSFDDQNRLVSKPSGKCLDIGGHRSSANGANLQLWDCEVGSLSDHRWEFVFHPNSQYFQIRNMDTGKCVDVSGWSDTDNASNVQQWDCEDFDATSGGNQSDHWWEMVVGCGSD